MVKPEEAFILVIEDNDMLREMLFKRMMMAKYQSAYFLKTAGEALGFLCRARPVDLILIDLVLDERDAFLHGCEAGVHFRKHWPKTRQLYMTGYDQNEINRSCQPGTEWVAKPFGVDELFDKIAEVLAR